jgi:hypothetical protein
MMKKIKKRYPEKYKEFLMFEAFDKNPYEVTSGIGSAFIRPKEELLIPMYSKDGSPIKAKLEDTSQEMQVGKRYYGERRLIDRRKYVKVYVEFIGDLIKQGLSMPGIKMLFFILKRLEDDSDVVQFTTSAARGNTGYKYDKSIYEGLVELIKMGVIARKEGSDEQFFINPQLIFRGNRQYVYLEALEAKRAEESDNPQPTDEVK